MVPGDETWLQAELRRLLSFGTTARPGAWLDDDGLEVPGRLRETWLAARTLHVRSLGMMGGVEGSESLAAAALAALLGPFFDATHGGWLPYVDPRPSSGEAPKGCYEHMFVLLAANTAWQAGLPGAGALRERAEEVVLDKFWDDNAGMCVDSWSCDWSVRSEYRGLNSTMHGVEAMLAHGGEWIERALRVCLRVTEVARGNHWRLPEHYDENWRPLLEANRDQPNDPFKPFGATVGHALEWSRLLLDLEAELGSDAPPELLEAALELYGAAVRDGWHVDGHPGFVYTTDWSGAPIVRERMHWVMAEAIAAASTLFRRTNDNRFESDYRQWWSYTDTYLVDRERGSWHHELDSRNRPASSVWPGKPDLYHAVQAVLIPRFPVGRSIALSLSAAR